MAEGHPLRRPYRTLVLLVLAAALVLAVGLWAVRPALVRALAHATLTPPAPPLSADTGRPSLLLPTSTPTPPALGANETTPSPGGPPSAAVAWLAGHALPIESVEPGNSAADIAELRDLIGPARVVVVDDEAGFGAHETQAFRQRLLELLVEQMGVRTLVLPIDWAAGDELDRYVQGAPLDPLQTLDDIRQARGPAGGAWQTQELLYTLRWLRLHNQAVAPGQRVSIRAVMPIERSWSEPAEMVQRYIWQVDPSMTFMSTGWGRKLSAYLEAHRAAFEAAGGTASFDRALRAAHAIEQAQAVSTAAGADERARRVTQLLNQNLAAVVEDAGGSGKTVIWTQGLASLEDEALQNLLALARRQRPPAVVTLGFAFGRGSLYLPGRAAPLPTTVPYAATDGDPALRFAVYTLPAAPAGSFEDFLAHAGLARYFVGLRDAPVPWDGPAWLREPPLVRSLAGAYWECRPDDYFRRADPRALYDIMVYFDRVTPIAPLFKPETAAPAACP